MSKQDVFKAWLEERNIEDVEAFVPDMAGAARGKVMPADKFGSSAMKMPETSPRSVLERRVRCLDLTREAVTT